MSSFEEIDAFINEVIPALIRPSYVLSGAAMNVCYNSRFTPSLAVNVERVPGSGFQLLAERGR